MNIDAIAENLLRLVQSVENRNLGHTRSALAHAKKIDAVFITHSHEMANSLGVKYFPYKNPANALGHRGPVVVDHHVWESITKDLLTVVQKLKKEKRDHETLLNKIHDLTSGFE